MPAEPSPDIAKARATLESFLKESKDNLEKLEQMEALAKTMGFEDPEYETMLSTMKSMVTAGEKMLNSAKAVKKGT